MKRRFIYQDAKSDKFWDIDFEGTPKPSFMGKQAPLGAKP